MKVYVVVVLDRHYDPDVKLFTNLEQALAVAQDSALEINEHYASYLEQEDVEGWLFYANCSEEGDYVFVVEKELDAE